MQIGIVGLPYTGKTTLFNALSGLDAPTGKYVESKGETNRGIVKVPDDRIDKLAEIYNPKKTTYATIEFCDVAGFKKGASEDSGLSGQLLSQLRDVDALAILIRVFERESVPHPDSHIDPEADIDAMLTEIILADLAIAEKRVVKIDERIKRGIKDELEKLIPEKKVLGRIIETLSAGKPIRSIEINEDEEVLLRGFGFLTQKPALVIANVGDLTSDIEKKRVEDLKRHCDENKLTMLALNADLECELREIEDPEEQEEYMSAMGITERVSSQVIRACYDVTHSICFLTTGPDEVRAWPIPEGCKAMDAGGVIHSDIARGFIRAEVVTYEHLIECGSFSKAKESAYYKEEGRDAIIHDGDVINFKFSV